MNKVYDSPAEAIHDIPDGATIMFGGFVSAGSPTNLIERAGGFEPLRFVPKGKVVALGLISTKTPGLEPQGLLMRRIEGASKYVPLENLALTPQCGFASLMHGNPLSWDDQRRKLELLVSTARKVWG